MNLRVNEIFYSLQGEGARMGEASIFIRLSKCNLACEFCDTEFESGEVMSIDSILEKIKDHPCKWIIWTGGEPTLQLRDEHLASFKNRGYMLAIETNGTRAVPSLIDYIACSPKVKYDSIKNVIPRVNEIRIPIRKGDSIPDISIFPDAEHYFLSPIFDAQDSNRGNIQHCVNLVLENPQWKLSVQMHKLINIE